MPYDSDLVRQILRALATTGQDPIWLGTDGVALSPPAGLGYGPEVYEHIDRLVNVGLIRRTNEIKMRNHLDPVVLRSTEEGREWVRRALDEDAWNESRPALEHLLEGEAQA